MQPITAQTKVGTLLAEPALEQALLEFAPVFAKLKNPVLRRTVARVASLRQAAELAEVDVAVLVGRLRQVAGQQPELTTADRATDDGHADVPRPSWADPSRAAVQLDAEALLDAGDNPLGEAQRQLRQLGPDQLLAVRALFRPAPLIELLRQQGHDVWSEPQGDHWITLVRAHHDA